MKKLPKSMLFPLITGVIVAVSLILPWGLSTLRDISGMRGMHREPFSSAVKLPHYRLSVEERYRLLARYGALESKLGSQGIKAFSQQLNREETWQLLELVNGEFSRLLSCGVLLQPLELNENLDYCFVERYYLQDTETMDTLRLLYWDCSLKQSALNLQIGMDEESRTIMTLRISGPGTGSYVADSPEAIAEAFLDRLGLDHRFNSSGTDHLQCVLVDEETYISVYNREMLDVGVYWIGKTPEESLPLPVEAPRYR